MVKEEDFPRSDLTGGILTFDKRKKATFGKLDKFKSNKSEDKDLNEFVSDSLHSEDLKLPSLETINPGSLVLGTVALVTGSGLRIHILNNIVGFAKYSELYDSVDSNLNSPNNSFLSPFSIGSNVVCYVLEVYHGYVSVSLKPSLINQNLRLSNLFPGLLLPCTVLSQEDHGFTVSFNVTVKGSHNGFVMYDESSREHVKNDMIKKYPVSSTAYVVVSSVNMDRGLIKCQWPWVYKTPVDFNAPVVFDMLKPGLVLVAQVASVHRLKSENDFKAPFGGYTVKCLDSLTGYVSSLDSFETYKQTECEELDTKTNMDVFVPKSMGDMVEARLIFVDFDRKSLYFSLQSHLMRWRGPSGLAHKNLKHEVSSCKIIRSFSSGFILESNENDEKKKDKMFYCNVNDIVDDKTMKPSTILSSQKYSVGSVHDCRILDFNYFTRLTHVSLKKSVIEEKYVSPLELTPSEVVKGKIIKLVNSGAIVQISSLVHGKVPLGHLTQVPLSKLPEGFQTGRNLRLRVLNFDHPRNKLILTAKNVLVNDTNPLVRFEQLHVGKELIGYVINKKEKGYSDDVQKDKVIIKFYNGLQTFLDKDEVERAKEYSIDLKTDSVVKCAVTKFENETKIRELENRISENEWLSNPNSVADYERLVVTNSSSSAVWIAYMAFHLNSGDLEMARKTVKRGLKAIDFREMVEKRNLWVAYLNMECIYGDKVMEIFKEAVQYNDAKIIYLKMINIFITNNQLDKAKEICEKGIKKFYRSKKVWLAYLKLLYENCKDFEGGRQLHKICVSRIPQHKRIFMTSSTALLEYKFGSPEVGKMYFENILLDNPKRMDIWNQYITAHIKFQMTSNEIPKSEKLKNVRNLFERAITLDLKPKKMKIIFSKWLEFECTHGNEKSKEMVQKKALKYVEYMEKKLIN